MSYQTFLKIWIRYNVAARRNICRDLLKLFPMICIFPMMFNIGANDPAKVALLLVSFMGSIFTLSMRIRPSKIMYIEPISEGEKIRYVRRGYITRLAVGMGLYMTVSLIMLLLKMITLPYFFAGNIGNYLAQQCISDMYIIHVDGMPQKKYQEMSGLLYDIYYQVVWFLIMLLAIFMEMYTVNISYSYGITAGRGYLIVVALLLFPCILFMMYFHKKKYKGLICMCASYESLVSIRKKLELS